MASRTKSSTFAFSESDLPVRFGRYLLLKRRSDDAIGEEFLSAWGVDEGVDQLRVMRGIYPSVAEEAEFIALFSEEARSLSRLASANVVRVMEVGVEGAIPFVACEHVEGATLARLIDLSSASENRCPWEVAVHIAAELLRGLDYVHRREDVLGKPMSMRHGDVRPANVLVSFNGEVKLTNFGSALYFIADEKTNARVQTYRGIYAPPELASADEATVAGDLWGVSAILATLLGRDDIASVDSWNQEPGPPAISEILEFLERALNKDPAARYEDAASMREVLLGVLRDHSTGHPPDQLGEWTQLLGGEDRTEEQLLVRQMLGQDPRMSLGEAAGGEGRLGPGTMLDDRYHILRPLGEGGMGVVFEAEHEGIGRHVAVKVLHERVLDDEVAVERFRREARITGSLGHPNIVGVSDFGVTREGYHYLVMDLLDGESLGERIQQGVVDPWELARIMAQVCEGLDAAHRAGVVHRDLKPENIFLTSGGARILDFGIAKRTGLEETEQALTRTGHICGTAEYLAPEQVRGQDPDYRCDIYAAGVIIYESLTLETPFRGRTVGETLHKVMSDKVVPPRKRSGNDTIPKRLESICLRALARRPQKRFTSAAEMAESLRDFLENEEWKDRGAQPSAYSRRKRGRRYWLALSLVVLMGAAAGIALLGFGLKVWQDLHPEQPEIARPEPQEAPEERVETTASVKILNSSEEEPKPEPDAGEKAETAVAKQTAAAALKKSTPARTEPRETKAKNGRAKELVAEGNRELKRMNIAEAVQLFEQALLHDPRIPQAWYGLGRASFEQGRYAEAAKKMEYALRLSPGQYGWRVYLGRIYHAMDEKDKAITEWQRVLKTDPDNQRAQKLLTKIGAL